MDKTQTSVLTCEAFAEKMREAVLLGYMDATADGGNARSARSAREVCMALGYTTVTVGHCRALKAAYTAGRTHRAIVVEARKAGST